MELEAAQVLIVDDDIDLRVLLRKVLISAGMRVVEASDVDEAFQVAAKYPPHIIISDLNMPGQSGFTLIDRVRKTSWLKSVPIVVLTSQNDQSSIFRSISLGANDYVLKPFQVANLTRKLRKVLKDQDIRRHTFEQSEEPVATLEFDCSLTELGEAGLRLEAPIRLAPELSIRLSADLLTELDVRSDRLRTSARAPMLRQQGQYLNELTFAGMDEALLKNIRRFTRGPR